MTCIVGFIEEITENKKIIWMGCDSAISDGWNYRLLSGRDKILKVSVDDRTKFMIGFTGYLRIKQLMEYQMEIPSNDRSNFDEYLGKDFIPVLRTTLKDNGFLKVDNNAETFDGNRILIGTSQGFYHIEPNFQFSSHLEKYEAIGSGTYYALGALSIMRDIYTIGANSEAQINYALTSASMFCNGVKAPFYIEQMTIT